MELRLTPDLLPFLNSLTKYPSIPTYHPMGEKGRLQPDPIQVPDAPVILTEKVDGTNARILIFQSQVLLGSREHLLWAEGDLIGDPAQGIVAHLRPYVPGLADDLCRLLGRSPLVVLYGELYGGKVTAASRQYTGEGKTAFRLFDVACFTEEQLENLSQLPPEQLALWRERNEQPWVSGPSLQGWADEAGFPLVPSRGAAGPGAFLPQTHEQCLKLLQVCGQSDCTLDERAGGRAEGLVARTADRRWIAKLRVEDYERTLRKK